MRKAPCAAAAACWSCCCSVLLAAPLLGPTKDPMLAAAALCLSDAVSDVCGNAGAACQLVLGDAGAEQAATLPLALTVSPTGTPWVLAPQPPTEPLPEKA